MRFVKTIEILTPLKALLEAATVAEDTPEKLFEEVVLFPTPEMGSAIKRLVISKTRICAVVPSGDDYVSTGTADYAETVATQEFDLLFADRVWSKTKNTAAVFGGGSNIGVVPMKDRVLEILYGQSLGIAGVAMVPLAGSFVTVKDDQDPKQKDSPGRESYMSTWTTWAGEQRASVGADGW